MMQKQVLFSVHFRYKNVFHLLSLLTCFLWKICLKAQKEAKFWFGEYEAEVVY